jgi:dihydroflavonol-4-reductase
MILVTGGTGHVGNVLVRRLLAEGERVRALILPGDTCDALGGLDVACSVGSVLDPDSLDSAMEGVDTVYHLAGIISIMPGAETLMRRVNVEGVRNVAAAALRQGVGRVVHVSSIHAFQRMPEGVIVDETTPLALEGEHVTYDQTKAQGTQAMLEAVQRGLNAVIACPTAIIGPYDFRGSLLGNALVNFAKRKLHLLIPGAYDFVDVRDIVDGLLLAREKGRSGEIYILSGTYATLAQARETVQSVAGIHSGQVTLPWRLALAFAAGMQHIYRLAKATPRFTPYSLRTLAGNAHFSSGKAQRELGFSVRPMTDTVRDMLAWHLRAVPAMSLMP